MANSESALQGAEQKQTAEEFIATITPMTAASGQLEVLRELGDIVDHDSVLEIWCGAGDLTAQLSAIAGRVVGTDYSSKLIIAARERFPHIEFDLSEAHSLGYPDESFDVVVSNFSAHHYASPEQIFSEARRVLKRGGRLLVTMPIQSQRIGFNIVLDAARESMNLPQKVLRGGPLHDAEFPDEVIAVLKAAGFQGCRGYARTHYTVLDSMETLLDYAWKKASLGEAPQRVQNRIRTKATEKANAYMQADGSYRFPDRLLAVRADV